MKRTDWTNSLPGWKKILEEEGVLYLDAGEDFFCSISTATDKLRNYLGKVTIEHRTLGTLKISPRREYFSSGHSYNWEELLNGEFNFLPFSNFTRVESLRRLIFRRHGKAHVWAHKDGAVIYGYHKSHPYFNSFTLCSDLSSHDYKYAAEKLRKIFKEPN